jgi:Protein of unknown function (DUF3775)
MDELAMDPAYLRMLILKVRALMAKEETDIDDVGDNAVDDESRVVLQESADDLSRDELVQEIGGLDLDQQNELVALMWIGRGDAEAEDWDEMMAQAESRHEISTAEYLLGHPELADYWAEGLEKLGHGTSVLEDGEF